MRRASFPLLLALMPASVGAQTVHNPVPEAASPEPPITGSRLGIVGTMVQSVGEGTPTVSSSSPEDAVASRFAGYVAKCTSDRKPALVDEYLHVPESQAKVIWAQIDPSFTECFHNYAFAMRYWGGLSMNIPMFLLRGKLAEARIAKLAARRLPPAAVNLADSAWTSGEHADEMLLVVGACVGATEPEASLKLLRATPGSKDEVADTVTMLPEAKQHCVPAGQVLSVPMSNLRAAIALGLYHRFDGTTVAIEKN